MNEDKTRPCNRCRKHKYGSCESWECEPELINLTNEQAIEHLTEYLDQAGMDVRLSPEDTAAIARGIEVLKAHPCEDAVSREAMLDKIKEVCFSKEQKWVDFRVSQGSNGQRDFIINFIESLPPVTPEQKKGVWVAIDQEPHETWECGLCGFVIDASSWRNPEERRDSYKYCPHCGAKMEADK